MEEESQQELLHGLLDILKHLYQMTMDKLIDALKILSDYKDDAQSILAWMLSWYRDVLVFQMTKKGEQLHFSEEAEAIRKLAGQYRPQELQDIFEAIQRAGAQVRANVNFELAFEMLLMTARGQDRHGKS